MHGRGDTESILFVYRIPCLRYTKRLNGPLANPVVLAYSKSRLCGHWAEGILRAPPVSVHVSRGLVCPRRHPGSRAGAATFRPIFSMSLFTRVRVKIGIVGSSRLQTPLRAGL